MGVAAVIIARAPLSIMTEFVIVLMAVPLMGLRKNVWPYLRLTGAMIVLVFMIGLIFFGLEDALLLSMRLFTLLTVSLIFFHVTDPQEMGDALQKLGLPFEFSFILTTAMRYVPLMGRKVRQISDAQQARGIDLKPGLKNIPNLMALMIPLLTQSFMLADDLALAMESRGFGCKGRSTRRTYHLAPMEYGVMGVFLGLLIAFTWWERMR
jgi:energy-coupling factor transport system permease protein